MTTQSNNQTGGITVGKIQADNVAGGNIEKVIKVINQDSSIKDILMLLNSMKQEIENIEVSDEKKKEAKACIDNATAKAKTDKPDKKSIAESLEKAGKILEGASTTAIKATAFGQMLSQGLIWAGQSMGWL